MSRWVTIFAVAVSGWFAASACGGRTGDDFADVGGGLPIDPLEGGVDPGSTGGAGVGGGGGSGVGGGGSPGVGGGPGAGGVSWGGAGGAAGCFPPDCRCSDCFSACLCATGEGSRCRQICAGSPPHPGVPDDCVARLGCWGEVVPLVGIELSPCCTWSSGRLTCGVDTSPVAAFAPGMPSGCVARDQPGVLDPNCPVIQTPLMPLAGCCKPEGLCGTDYDAIGLGCVAPDGAAGTGGSAVLCGWGGSGGTGTGGFTGTGGATGGAGGSSPVAQCIAQARTECERCACSHCFDLLADCFGDEGCPRILQCANLTGCSGIDCYALNTCQAVIDRYGGPFGTSANLALPLFQCLQASGCRCGFAGQ